MYFGIYDNTKLTTEVLKYGALQVNNAARSKEHSEDAYWKSLKNFKTEPNPSAIPSADIQRMMMVFFHYFLH